MAVVDILTPTTAAASSAEFVCDGIAEITVGLYGTIHKRVGATVMIEGSGGFEPYRDDRGRLITLTQSDPQVKIGSAGNYRVDKPATLTAVGAWEDPGATGGGGGGGDYVPLDPITSNATSASGTSTQNGNQNTQSGYNNTQAGNRNNQSGYTNTQTGSYNTQSGEHNSQSINSYSMQSGGHNTQTASWSSQSGWYNVQGGSYNTQSGSYNTQAGQYSFQAGTNLDDGGFSHVNMFGASKTATEGNRAYFALDNGVWLKPVTAPSTPETGVIYYDSGLNKLRVRTAAGWETVTSV